LKGTHPAKFGLIWFSGIREEGLNAIWTLNFCRFWPIMQIRKKGEWNLKKIFSSETTRPISTGLSDTILKGTHPAKFGLIWFSSIREEGLNAICYQNMPNLHNPYILAERKISQKNTNIC
jgi:hypothetical protein